MVLFLGTDDKCHIIPIHNITDPFPFDDRGFIVHTDTKILDIRMFDNADLARSYALKNYDCDLITHS
jgi:hypothetical protein